MYYINHAYKSPVGIRTRPNICSALVHFKRPESTHSVYRCTNTAAVDASPASRKIRCTRILSTHVQIGYASGVAPQSFCLGRPILYGFLSFPLDPVSFSCTSHSTARTRTSVPFVFATYTCTLCLLGRTESIRSVNYHSPPNRERIVYGGRSRNVYPGSTNKM